MFTSCNPHKNTQHLAIPDGQMPHAISNSWFGFGHVQFAIGNSPLAISRNRHSAAWLGRNKKHVPISRQSAKKLGMPTHARICRQLRQVHDIYHICNAHAHAKLALQLHPFHT